MTYNPNDCQIGDLFIYPDRGWIGACSNGIGHISGVIREDLKPPTIGEAHLWTDNDAGKKISGTLRKTFNLKWDVRQFRLIGGLSNAQKQAIVKCFENEHEGKDAYNLISFPALWIWGTILQPLGLGNLSPGIQNQHFNNCGELWDVLYQDALGIDLFPSMARKMVTPGQFLRSPLLYEVNPTQIKNSTPVFQSDYNQLAPA